MTEDFEFIDQTDNEVKLLFDNVLDELESLYDIYDDDEIEIEIELNDDELKKSEFINKCALTSSALFLVLGVLLALN